MALQEKKRGKVLISACLLGENVRYNQVPVDKVSPLLLFFYKKGLLIPLCPEVEAGLPVPRPPAEIQQEESENQKSSFIVIRNSEGIDVSSAFYLGAEIALQICLKHGCKIAILKERSPSCGVHHIHDGHFSGNIIQGSGRTTKLLTEQGVTVFSEDQLDEAYRFWFFNC